MRNIYKSISSIFVTIFFVASCKEAPSRNLLGKWCMANNNSKCVQFLEKGVMIYWDGDTTTYSFTKKLDTIFLGETETPNHTEWLSDDKVVVPIPFSEQKDTFVRVNR